MYYKHNRQRFTNLSLIDKLVKMHVLKIFITGDICPFNLASLTDEP